MVLYVVLGVVVVVAVILASLTTVWYLDNHQPAKTYKAEVRQLTWHFVAIGPSSGAGCYSGSKDGGWVGNYSFGTDVLEALTIPSDSPSSTCTITNVSIAQPYFTVAKTNAPLNVTAGGSGLLTVLVQMPNFGSDTLFSSPLDIYIGNEWAA